MEVLAEETEARRIADQLRISQPPSTGTVEEPAARREANWLRVSQSRSAKTVEETAARREADRLRTSRARAEETAGEAAARREDQRQTAAARDGERLDPVDNVGDFTHNCRDIRPCALIVPLGPFLGWDTAHIILAVHIMYDWTTSLYSY